MGKKILILEDDSTIAAGLEYALEQEDFTVIVCRNVAESYAFFEHNDVDMALLDVSLPDGNGYDVCRFIKAKFDIPVLFLTVNDDEANVVMGLDLGADDYIAKPFRLRELISRIHSVFRRYRKDGVSKHIVLISDLIIHTSQAKVFKNKVEVILTALEYRLLLRLVNHEGQILSRNQLLEGLWDIAGDFVNDNTLSVYIKRLREKIETDPQNPSIIHTIRGLGYKAGE
ncbi:DNA-binding response regulator [Paenibacillus psychroresistens]|uniref:DNA-binding response regulator n=1 Tax=Paenibacillus psychroresistens TaxID=1778678 RepID=A0A6B8RP75_9BACL|nr:response regulator transcription factor [Paenibacillus psychroresistens]QGQ97303.1 DNA-binding response regulator [Paenibacillus psychroresistens]